MLICQSHTSSAEDIFNRSPEVEVGNQQITSLVDFFFFLSLISILANLGAYLNLN